MDIQGFSRLHKTDSAIIASFVSKAVFRQNMIDLPDFIEMVNLMLHRADRPMDSLNPPVPVLFPNCRQIK
jgi:hypothetical protein